MSKSPLFGKILPKIPAADNNIVKRTVTGASTSKGPIGVNTLRLGQSLTKGGELKSTDGRFQLLFQDDSNVVLYQKSAPLWHTATDGKIATSLIMQDDGNLVLYGKQGALWASGTSGYPGAYAQLQTTGNLVIVHRDTTLWASNTCRPKD